MKRLFVPGLLLAVTAGLPTLAHAGSIVLDGGFEIPAITGGVPYTGSLGDGWTATQGSIAVFANSSGEASHSGSQEVYLGWNSTVNTISQTLTTVAGQSYVISYWLADTTSDPVSVVFGSTTLFNGTAPSNGVNLSSEYVNYSFTATATSTSTVLSITGQWDGAGSGTSLDDVSVTAVPEPATLGFTGLACVGLLALRHKRA